MADCLIFVGATVPQNNKIAVTGQVFASPNNGPFDWTCEHEWGAIAVDINRAIRDAAVAVLAANNINVSEADKKTIFAAAADA